jgi:hypothetical protein
LEETSKNQLYLNFVKSSLSSFKTSSPKKFLTLKLRHHSSCHFLENGSDTLHLEPTVENNRPGVYRDCSSYTWRHLRNQLHFIFFGEQNVVKATKGSQEKKQGGERIGGERTKARTHRLTRSLPGDAESGTHGETGMGTGTGTLRKNIVASGTIV